MKKLKYFSIIFTCFIRIIIIFNIKIYKIIKNKAVDIKIIFKTYLKILKMFHVSKQNFVL